MTRFAEKRRDRRHDCNARIKWTQFNRRTLNYGQEIFYRARVLNFSRSGLYFETGCFLKPGSTILFRIEKAGCVTFDDEGYQGLRTISLADIKWCQDILKNGESYFGIGARYPILY